MKHWLRQLSFWLALFAGAAIAAELAFLEIERRKALRLKLEWRHQLRQSDELAKASPACTPQNEQAMSDEVLRWRREVEALRAELFPKSGRPAGEADADERIDAYFDVAALIVRLRAAAAEANVIVKPDEHFGFEAYANETPLAADTARLRHQCLIGETLLGCLFSGRPRELLAVRRESVDPSPKVADRQQVLARSLSLREGNDRETMAFRLEFSGETAALRGFLNALVQSGELLVVRSIEVVPAGGPKAGTADGRESRGRPVATQTLARFTVTVEAVRPTDTFAASTP